jgi:hypothetical protein
MSHDDDIDSRETHPAYGMAVFGRASVGGVRGKNRLFGSSIDSMNIITLTICQAEVYHSLGSDHFMGNKEIISVDMTEHQFAQLLTTMNQGDGVPVTIRHVNMKRTPPLPDTKVEAAKIVDKFRDDVDKWKKELSTTMAEIEGILAKKGALNQEEKKKITELTSGLVERIKGHTTFLLDQFDESIVGVVSQAKAEVDGFINSAVARTGLTALKGQASKLLGLDADKWVCPKCNTSNAQEFKNCVGCKAYRPEATL